MKRYITSFLVITALLIGLFIWNVAYGSVELSLGQIVDIFCGDRSDITSYNIIWQIRMPRIIAAIVLGGALSVSGFLLQSFFQNPIAGPYVLGISSGAKLVVALTMIFLLSQGVVINSFGMVAAAFAGSIQYEA